MSRSYSYFGNRRVTSNGFTRAYTLAGSPASFVTKNGDVEPVMLGVSEFALKGAEELFKGENHKQTSKVGAYPILWLPNAKGFKKGLSVNLTMYREAQEDPMKYADRVLRLAEYNIPMDINCD